MNTRETFTPPLSTSFLCLGYTLSSSLGHAVIGTVYTGHTLASLGAAACFFFYVKCAVGLHDYD